jgi:hypothetical protein
MPIDLSVAAAKIMALHVVQKFKKNIPMTAIYLD